MTANQPSHTTQDRQTLKNLRLALLRLHKLLLDSERQAYEEVHGRVTPNQLLNLVMHDEWFDWLHPISRLVVEIDDILKAEEVELLTHFNPLINQTQTLLTPDESGSPFAQKYYSAIQREPDVVLSHAALQEFLAAVQKK
jgi:hypothetical protein